mmetsp:Transcript_1804/g.6086  ORF Transcript_1804/g.6086 Transcript_1804/m.6086 type:complete len:257 (+) Transcript_1804:140-910(+)
MMASFILYCTVSILATASPNFLCSRSKRVTPRPFLSASSLMIVGGSCRWSPHSTALLPLRRALQVAHSLAWAASSTTTRSKSSLSICFIMQPVSVQATTWAFPRTSEMAFWCRVLTSLFRYFSSPLSFLLVSLSCLLSLISLRLISLISLTQSSASWLLSLLSTSESRHESKTCGRSLAGWPTRTSRNLFPFSEGISSAFLWMRSTRLSTATLDAAQTSTLCRLLTASWSTISTTVVVFPVPGGPWTIASSWARSA